MLSTSTEQTGASPVANAAYSSYARRAASGAVKKQYEWRELRSEALAAAAAQGREKNKHWEGFATTNGKHIRFRACVSITDGNSYSRCDQESSGRGLLQTPGH